MPSIKSPNPGFQQVAVPGSDTGYVHPADIRPTARPIPMAFQVTSPLNRNRVLLPHALVLHVNPLSLQETENQKVERIQTKGGWVEQHWGHELVEISADASTGAFMNIRTGTTSVLRQRTIAWSRFRDLHDLFRNNGSVYDPFGNIVLQGDILLMYDRGMYYGTFRSFEWEDTADTPFNFTLNWSFKITETLMSVDVSAGAYYSAAPQFQTTNTTGISPDDASTYSEFQTVIQQQQAQIDAAEAAEAADTTTGEGG